MKSTLEDLKVKHKIITSLLPKGIKTLTELLDSNISNEVKIKIWLSSMDEFKKQK